MNIKNNDLTIWCSNNLQDFSNEFITYYNSNIEELKRKLLIFQNVKIKAVLTSEENENNYVYGKSDFAGFFNDSGLFAYINLDSNKSKDYMFRGLMHEIVHHLYKYYVYGADKPRITWVDEGLAQLFSGQNGVLKDEDKYNLFIEENLKYIDNIDLNKLNHNDRSFGNNNGYNLSYIAIRYLYETNNHDEFINIIKSEEKLLKYGNEIIDNMKEYYKINNKKLHNL